MTCEEFIAMMPFFIVAIFRSALTEFLRIVSRSLWIEASCSTMGLMVSAGVGFGFLLLRNMMIEVMIIPNESMIEMIMTVIKKSIHINNRGCLLMIKLGICCFVCKNIRLTERFAICWLLTQYANSCVV